MLLGRVIFGVAIIGVAGYFLMAKFALPYMIAYERSVPNFLTALFIAIVAMVCWGLLGATVKTYIIPQQQDWEKLRDQWTEKGRVAKFIQKHALLLMNICALLLALWLFNSRLKVDFLRLSSAADATKWLFLFLPIPIIFIVRNIKFSTWICIGYLFFSVRADVEVMRTSRGLSQSWASEGIGYWHYIVALIAPSVIGVLVWLSYVIFKLLSKSRSGEAEPKNSTSNVKVES